MNENQKAQAFFEHERYRLELLLNTIQHAIEQGASNTLVEQCVIERLGQIYLQLFAVVCSDKAGQLMAEGLIAGLRIHGGVDVRCKPLVDELTRTLAGQR